MPRHFIACDKSINVVFTLCTLIIKYYKFYLISQNTNHHANKNSNKNHVPSLLL